MNREVFEKLVIIKKTINELKATEEELTSSALQMMEDSDADSVELNDGDEKVGTFSKVSRGYWSYPEEVKIQIEKIQNQSRLEKTATEKITTSLTFRAFKLKEDDENSSR